MTRVMKILAQAEGDLRVLERHSEADEVADLIARLSEPFSPSR